MVKTRQSPNFGEYAMRLIRELSCDGRFGMSRTYSKTRSSFLLFLFGEGRCDIPVSELGPGLVDRYNRYLSGRGVVRNTVSFYNRVLRAIYNKAVLEYRLPDLRPFAEVMWT